MIIAHTEQTQTRLCNKRKVAVSLSSSR